MEPGMNQWLGSMIGDPAKLICSIGQPQPDGSLADVRGELDGLAKTREVLAGQIETARKDLQSADENRKAMLDSLRNAQPVNVVLGNKADVIAKLAGEGITTEADLARMTAAVSKRLERAGIQTEAELTDLKNKATEFLKRG
jgi:translation initiation factor 2B subunit (eIF-2B alpha/beta/delta family)